MKILKYFASAAVALLLTSCDSGNSGLNKASDDEKQGGLNRPKVDYSLGRAMNNRLGRGINMGNSWESTGSGTNPDCGWGNCLKDEDLQIIKNAGFNSVRIPVRWENDVDVNNTVDAVRLAGVHEDVSIAIGQGTDVAMDVAQVTLMSTDLRALPEAVRLSDRIVRTIRQNLFWAFVYNIVCIPLAAGLPRAFGIDFQMTPMLASALMALSSVSVVLNSLRLKR